MTQNESIEIMQVANGFLVRAATRPDSCYPIEHSRVFQTFVELTNFLDDHFTHRTKMVDRD